jgi:hypothetical protein
VLLPADIRLAGLVCSHLVIISTFSRARGHVRAFASAQVQEFYSSGSGTDTHVCGIRRVSASVKRNERGPFLAKLSEDQVQSLITQMCSCLLISES